MCMATLPFCHFSLRASKPRCLGYPTELKTIGDHLRKRHRDFGLLQKEVGQRIGGYVASIWNWEAGKRQPELKRLLAIIARSSPIDRRYERHTEQPAPRGDAIALNAGIVGARHYPSLSGLDRPFSGLCTARLFRSIKARNTLPMALKIRLTRIGTKHQPHYRVVVAEARSRRDGDPTEVLGTYDPRVKFNGVKLDMARVDYWLSKGARPSDTLHALIKKARRAASAAPAAAGPADAPAAAPAATAAPA